MCGLPHFFDWGTKEARKVSRVGAAGHCSRRLAIGNATPRIYFLKCPHCRSALAGAALERGKCHERRGIILSCTLLPPSKLPIPKAVFSPAGGKLQLFVSSVWVKASLYWKLSQGREKSKGNKYQLSSCSYLLPQVTLPAATVHKQGIRRERKSLGEIMEQSHFREKVSTGINLS